MINRATALPKDVGNAIMEFERAAGVQVVIVSSGLQEQRLRDRYPDSVFFAAWTHPTEYAGQTTMWNARANPEGGVLPDCYALADGKDPNAYFVPWTRGAVGTIRPMVVFDFVGVHRITKWTPLMLEEMIVVPLQKALAMVDDGSIDRATAAFTKYVTRNRANQLETHNTTVRQWRDGEANARMELTRMAQELVNAERELQQFLGQGDDQGERMVKEWNLVAGHPRCEKLAFAGQTITMQTTDDLRLHWPDVGSRWMGAFAIKLNLATTHITVKNLSTQRRGSDHPHIHGEEVCFGEYADQVVKLIARGDLYSLFEFMLQFLETFNFRDYYARYAAYWFDVPDERPLEPKPERVAVAA